MDLVVGRMRQPHGVRGEVTVDVRTDDPDARFAPGSVAAHRPGERGPLTVTGVHPRSGGLVVAFEGVGDRARPPRRCAAPCWWSTPTVAAADRGPRRVLRPPAGRPAAVDPAGGVARRRSPSRARAGHRPARGPGRGRPRAPGPVRPGDRPGRGRGRRPGRGRRRPRGCSTCEGSGDARSTSSRSSRSTWRRWSSRCSARRSSAACSTCACTTCGAGPTTCTAPSTTPRTAAGRAW